MYLYITINYHLNIFVIPTGVDGYFAAVLVCLSLVRCVIAVDCKSNFTNPKNSLYNESKEILI